MLSLFKTKPLYMISVTPSDEYIAQYRTGSTWNYLQEYSNGEFSGYNISNIRNALEASFPTIKEALDLLIKHVEATAPADLRSVLEFYNAEEVLNAQSKV
jgi:hypothetical protein